MANRLVTQALWVEGSIATFNSSTLYAGGQLGEFCEQNGAKYQLVKLDSSAVTAAAGNAVAWIGDSANFTVTNDISDTKQNRPAGVLLTAVTAGNYCFIQVRGDYGTVKTDGGDDIAEGDYVWLDDSVDGGVDSTAAGNASIFQALGVALAADVDANNTVAVQLFPPLNGA